MWHATYNHCFNPRIVDIRDLSNEAQLRCMMVKAVPFPQTLELFYSFYNFCFSPFTEALQVRDMTMCDSSWSVFYAAICTYKAKALKGEKKA